MHRNKVTYSITSSARARKVCGISRPSALAVLRLRSGQPPDACNCPIVLRDGDGVFFVWVTHQFNTTTSMG
jgi:hypothetical protein